MVGVMMAGYCHTDGDRRAGEKETLQWRESVCVCVCVCVCV